MQRRLGVIWGNMSFAVFVSLHLSLFFQHENKIFSLVGRNNTFVLWLIHDVISVLQDPFCRGVVLAGWHQGAFGASGLAQHVARQHNSALS